MTGLARPISLRSRYGRIIRYRSRSQIRDEYIIDYVLGARYTAQIPLIEGRFLEAILKAEQDVASTAAGNRGHEKPGTAARQKCLVAWSLRAGPGNGDGGGTWADNATAERREACLPVAREVSLPRKRGVARYCATTSRLDVSGRSANPPRSGVGSDEGEKEEEEPGGKNAPGMKKLGCLTG